MNARQRWLALALAVTLAVAFWPAREDEVGDLGIVAAGKPDARQQAAVVPQSGKPAPAAVHAEADERFAAKAEGDLFPRQTWVPPPPPPPKPPPPLPPPPPKPPALPFSYLGRWAEQGRETVFLAQGERVLQARKGDVLAVNWRLDESTPNQLVFTYLPMDMTQTMRISP